MTQLSISMRLVNGVCRELTYKVMLVPNPVGVKRFFQLNNIKTKDKHRLLCHFSLKGFSILSHLEKVHPNSSPFCINASFLKTGHCHLSNLSFFSFSFSLFSIVPLTLFFFPPYPYSHLSP